MLCNFEIFRSPSGDKTLADDCLNFSGLALERVREKATGADTAKQNTYIVAASLRLLKK